MKMYFFLLLVPSWVLKKCDFCSQYSFYSIHSFKEEACERTGDLKLLLKGDLWAGMRVYGTNICLISCILSCSKAAPCYTIPISASQGGSSCWYCGRCQAKENVPTCQACCALCFWKWVCGEDQSPDSDAIHACHKCSPINFLKFNTVTERLELIPEYHLTLTSPVTVCWSKKQCCPSDKYKFWY